MQNEIHIEKRVKIDREKLREMVSSLPFNIVNFDGGLPKVYVSTRRYGRRQTRTIYLTAPNESMAGMTNFSDSSIIVYPGLGHVGVGGGDFSIKYRDRRYFYVSILDILLEYEKTGMSLFRDAIDDAPNLIRHNAKVVVDSGYY